MPSLRDEAVALIGEENVRLLCTLLAERGHGVRPLVATEGQARAALGSWRLMGQFDDMQAMKDALDAAMVAAERCPLAAGGDDGE